MQEAWLRWHRADQSRVAEPRAYLVKLTTCAALDRLRRARAEREVYVGSWLPEPLVTGPDVAENAALADLVSMAMLVVLETLSPLERSVFVLREAFGFSHAEIAEALDRSEPSIRQVAHRARRHVEARHPRFETDRRLRREATERFMHAALRRRSECADGSAGSRCDDVVGHRRQGTRTAPADPRCGEIVRWFAGTAHRVPADATIRLIEVNGGSAAVMVSAGAPIAVVAVDIDPDSRRITAIRIVGNPDKLAVLPTGAY